MTIRDLHELPKLSDSWSYLYVERCRVDQEAKAIAVHDEKGRVPVPCASLSLLMLGPGVSITHAAVSVLADHGCLVVWCGEAGVRFYASGMGETRSAANLLHQARLWADKELRMKVVRNMYQRRFAEVFDPEFTLQQIRGMEGARIRDAYAKAARETGVKWMGRSYRRRNWYESDPVNRALSAANACLYGVCHAGIVSAGFSPALGFIHTGKMLFFVYDIADLYKAEISIPVAFEIAAEGGGELERRVRLACRDRFVSGRLLSRIVPDIQSVLSLPGQGITEGAFGFDDDAAAPGFLWDPVLEEVEGGRAYEVTGGEWEGTGDRPDSGEGPSESSGRVD